MAPLSPPTGLLLWTLLAACAQREAQQPVATPERLPQEAPAPLSPLGEAMQIHIQSAQDFPAVNLAYAKLVRQDGGSERALEVLLAGGEYSGLHLTLKQPATPEALRLSVRGEAGAQVVLRGIQMDLAGSDVTVENLVFAGGSRGVALKIRASEGIDLARLAFLDKEAPAGGRGSRRQGGVLRLEAGSEATTLAMRDCWFVGNQANPGAPLLRVLSRSGGWDGLLLERVVFIDNSGAPLLFAQANTFLSLKDSFVALEPGAAPLLSAGSPGLRLQVQDSTLLLDSEEALLRPAVPEIKPIPAEVSGGRILTRASEQSASTREQLRELAMTHGEPELQDLWELLELPIER